MASISTQTKDPTRAKYKVRWREADGSARAESFTTMAAAKARKREIEGKQADGTYVPAREGRVLFSAFALEAAESWHDLSDATRDRYLVDLETKLIPLLGTREIGKIDARRVQQTVDAIARGEVSGTKYAPGPETVRKAFYVLRRVMADAVAHRLIERTPCEGIRLPKIERIERVPVGADVVEKLSLSLPDEYRAVAFVGGDAGLRIGEILALRWEDVDLTNRTIRVRRSVSESGGRLREKTTKSDKVRSVPLTRRTVDALADLREWHDPAPSDLVFAAARGGHYRPGLFRSRVFYPAAQDAGLDDLVPHDLRHSAITSWIENGASVVLASRWAGHSDPGFTLRRYGHLTPLHADDVLDRLDAR